MIQIKFLGVVLRGYPFFNVVILPFSSRSNPRIHRTFGKTYLSVLLICAFYMDVWFWGLNSFFFKCIFISAHFCFWRTLVFGSKRSSEGVFPPFSYILVGCPLIWKQSLIPCIYSKFSGNVLCVTDWSYHFLVFSSEKSDDSVSNLFILPWCVSFTYIMTLFILYASCLMFVYLL